jgi:hypothetical protein
LKYRISPCLSDLVGKTFQELSKMLTG